jgi:hypothetical protein
LLTQVYSPSINRFNCGFRLFVHARAAGLYTASMCFVIELYRLCGIRLKATLSLYSIERESEVKKEKCYHETATVAPSRKPAVSATAKSAKAAKSIVQTAQPI